MSKQNNTIMKNVQESIDKLSRVKSLLVAIHVATQELQEEWDDDDGDVAEMLNHAYPFKSDFADVVVDIRNWRETVSLEIDNDIQDLKEEVEPFYVPLMVIKQTVGWEEFLRVTDNILDYKAEMEDFDDGHVFTITKKQARELGFPIK